jgi:hypothetical protein
MTLRSTVRAPDGRQTADTERRYQHVVGVHARGAASSTRRLRTLKRVRHPRPTDASTERSCRAVEHRSVRATSFDVLGALPPLA